MSRCDDFLKQYYGVLSFRDYTLLDRSVRTLRRPQSLLEVLSLDRKILEKPPNWNLPVQEVLFSPLLL